MKQKIRSVDLLLRSSVLPAHSDGGGTVLKSQSPLFDVPYLSSFLDIDIPIAKKEYKRDKENEN